jgi:uncharacterized protein
MAVGAGRYGRGVHELDGYLVVSPTDLTRFLACHHLTRLDLEVARGLRAAPGRPGEALELLFARGLAHEREYLAGLRAQGRSVTVIDLERFGTGRAGLRAAEQATVEAMAAGADVVYQATLFDETWRGHADFLLRRPGRPGRWSWSYDLADTKLARRMKVPALLQLAAYADRLTTLQGVEPEQLIVVTGDGERRPYRYTDCAAYARGVRERFLQFVAEPPDTRPERVPHCGECRWQPDCRRQWLEQDDLTLVARLRRRHAEALRAAGIGTLTALAGAEPADLPARIAPALRRRLVDQARLQLQERTTGRPAHALLPPAPGRGLALLPQPSPGDVFFDMEGDPYQGEAGLEYLFGVVEFGVVEGGEYTGYWALDHQAERVAFEALVDHLIAAWDRDPGMHVYHYAPYEPARLKALAGRYDSRVEQVDRLLRGGRLIDLYTVVKQAVQIGKESYSLKKLEDHYWGHGRGGQVGDALGSVVAFERWLLERDDALLESIRAYNEEDCRSTRALRDWLEGLRRGAGGDDVHQRPRHGDGAPSTAVRHRAERSADLRGRLEAAAAASCDDAEAAALRLTAALLDWHRREALPQWSEYFRRRAAAEDELLVDPVAVAGLGPPEPVGEVRRSVRWRLQFPPQETALAAGDRGWVDPATDRTVGVVAEIRPAEGWLVLERAAGREPPAVRALVPPGPVDTEQLQARLAELAGWLVGHGVTGAGADRRAARDLLLRRPVGAEGGPAAAAVRRPGESALDAVLRLSGLSGPGGTPAGGAAETPAGGRLPAGVLAVQGPPGTGKTTVAAELVVRALAAGHRVGLCAFSHAAVSGLLAAVLELARCCGIDVRAAQKAEPGQGHGAAEVTRVDRPAEVADQLAAGTVTLTAGTAWLYADPGLQEALDLLVVDEAGQLSLANVLAVSGCARLLVLFGDPQQLNQPVLGVHPPGAGRSALEHVLDGRATLPPEVGVLLDTTYRMHPGVAGFVSRLAYDGRVRVAPGLERQRIESDGALRGSGLRWVPVPHRDDGSWSGAEAEVVAGLVAGVLADGVWCGVDVRRRLEPADVLVLTPYNQQVRRIRRELAALPGGDGVRVGTVDAMQGRQAPLVLYSLAASDARSAGRGLDFLLSPNRLTVALSRALALVAVVAAPGRLQAEASSPEQVLRIDALCRLADQAEPIVTPTVPPIVGCPVRLP